MQIIQLLKTDLGRFRIVAFLEGCSFLAIGITMLLKYGYAMPNPNYVVGLAHGVLFVLYCFMLLQISIAKSWGFKKMALGFLASLIPFGTFIADKHLFREAEAAK
jgi:integral membrane protein